MKKVVIVATLLLFVTACALPKQIRIRKEVQESTVPILYCPAPEEIEPPVLPIHTMTEEEREIDGEIAKRYKASVQVLQGYIEQLEKMLNDYKKANEAYDQLRKEIEAEIKNGKQSN